MNLRCYVLKAVNPIVYNTEMRLCNAAKNKAHIESDDYQYDKSCTVDT
jgi:hypothetical protein